MQAILVVHILAGSLSLVSGYLALYASKGAPLHRRAGMVFVAVMLTMTTTGTLVAAARGAAPALNIPAALITSYLVVTGLTAVRPPSTGARPLHIGAMVAAFAIGLVCLALGFEAVANGGTRKGMPAFPFFLFAFLGLLGGMNDLRMLRAGPAQGAIRLTRHLWRMTTALLIAAMSFFFGQADELPKALRVPALLASPVLAAFATLVYWLWRVRFRRVLRGLAVSGSPGVAR